MIAAILRAQLLSMRLGGRARSVLFSSVTGFIFYGFWAFAAWGASSFFADPDNAGYFPTVLPGGLLLAMAYWQFAPVISASLGASLELRKLLAYPIPRSTLFIAEVLLRITACAEMPLLVGGVAIGLLRNPGPGTGPGWLILTGALIFFMTNILLSAGVRQVMEYLFLRTRMREVVLLVFVAAGVLPQLLIMGHVKGDALLRLIPSGMAWPWGAVANLMLGRAPAPNVAVALLYLAASGWFGWWQFGRAIRHDSAGERKQERVVRPGGFADALARLPERFLPDPLAALIEKELRTLARISRFRFVYAMSCVFGLIVYLPWMRRAGHDSFIYQNALPVMSLYGLLMLGQISYWNAFGFDRSAIQGYFSWPIRFRDAMVAKNLAVGCLILPQVAVIAIFGRAMHLPASPAKVLETLVVALIAAAYWCTVGNMVSVRMPRPLDPDKLNQMSNKLQALSILASPLLLLPVALAYWARAVLDNQWIFVALLAISAIVGAIFYRIGLDSSVETARRERESLLNQLSRAEGPLSVG